MTKTWVEARKIGNDNDELTHFTEQNGVEPALVEYIALN